MLNNIVTQNIKETAIDLINFPTYTGNTNTWGGKETDGTPIGLIPMSTVGEIDSTVSRLMLFEKGSLTSTDGGYRLMASRVDNHTVTTAGTEEGKGFVAFDLFVKNMSGNEYYEEFNTLNEEAIYLTQASNVAVKLSGSGVLTQDDQDQLKTGIENSVRVAFAQIGRVVASTDKEAEIQAITCADGKVNGTGALVTGICKRYAQIWEPNDTKHVQNAINWYEGSCIKRTGTPANDAEGAPSAFTYASGTGNKCTTVADGTYSQTYPVGSVIDYTNYVDVYDGSAYNTFTKTINGTKISTKTVSEKVGDVNGFKASSENGKLYEYDYFTDSEKMQTGINRPIFMTLAPNSITKVRV